MQEFLKEYNLAILGALTLVFSYVRSLKTSKINEYVNTINMLRADIVSLKKDIVDSATDKLKLQNKLYEKDKLLTLIESTTWDLPFAYWFKDTQLTMMYINSQYEKQFNIKSADYVNKTDYDVWPLDMADKFVTTDKTLLASNNEFIIDTEEVESFAIIKWKRRAGSIVVGVAGICIPIKLLNNAFIRQYATTNSRTAK